MEILHLNEESFKQVLNEKDKIVLVDFYATWCGPCKMLAPILEEVRKEMTDDFIIGKIDVDECFDIARSYGVMSVPTLVLLKNGEEVERAIGLKPKQEIMRMMYANLDKK